MGRVKICRSCKEVLFCQECGERQSPESPDWEKVLVQLTPKQKERAKEEADRQGISLSEYIRRRIEGGESEEHTSPN